MKYRSVMAELKKMGTAQNRKVYARHMRLTKIDATKVFGVSFANLNLLKKQIKTDHDLALELWDSGNHDARVLAAMIADPERADNKTVETWAKGIDNYIITDYFAGVVARSKLSRKKMDKWTKSKNEWLGRVGWNLVTSAAGKDTELDDAYFDERLKTIETTIHTSKNRVRDAMNTALITIALRNSNLEKKARAVARRIGKVEVDHGDTGCKTPDAIEYIEKTKAYRAKKARKNKK